MKYLLLAVLLGVVAACGPTATQPQKSAAVSQGNVPVHVVVETDLGAMEWAVYPGRAPISAGHFLTHVDRTLYDGATFYRVVRPGTQTRPPEQVIEVVQGGLMGSAYGTGSREAITQAISPLPDIAHETTDMTGMENIYGTIALGRFAQGTASSEFYINLADNHVLDTGQTARQPDGQGYATFGTVVKGIEVLEAIQDLPTGPQSAQGSTLAIQILQDQVRILSIRRGRL